MDRGEFDYRAEQILKQLRDLNERTKAVVSAVNTLAWTVAIFGILYILTSPDRLASGFKWLTPS